MSERCETCIMVRTALYNQPCEQCSGYSKGSK